jgi:hypothetical protein
MSDKLFSTDELQEKVDAVNAANAQALADLKDTHAKQISTMEQKIAVLSEQASAMSTPAGKPDWQKLAKFPHIFSQIRATKNGRVWLGLERP